MKLCFKKQTSGAEEVDQWLRACAAREKDPGLIPSTHVVAHNNL